jgi:hypothetical protein
MEKHLKHGKKNEDQDSGAEKSLVCGWQKEREVHFCIE